MQDVKSAAKRDCQTRGVNRNPWAEIPPPVGGGGGDGEEQRPGFRPEGALGAQGAMRNRKRGWRKLFFFTLSASPRLLKSTVVSVAIPSNTSATYRRWKRQRRRTTPRFPTTSLPSSRSSPVTHLIILSKRCMLGDIRLCVIESSTPSSVVSLH